MNKLETKNKFYRIHTEAKNVDDILKAYKVVWPKGCANFVEGKGLYLGVLENSLTIEIIGPDTLAFRGKVEGLAYYIKAINQQQSVLISENPVSIDTV